MSTGSKATRPMGIDGAPVLRLGDKTMTFDEFARMWEENKPTSEEALGRLKEKVEYYEKKYGMTSEEFMERIWGTPDGDTPDFIRWAGHYKSYLRLLKGGGLGDDV